MGKKTVYFCDLCQAEVKEAKSNAKVEMKLSNQQASYGSFEPLICSKCAADKKPEVLLKELVAEAQRQTGLTEIASVAFLSVDTLGDIIGVEKSTVAVAPK